LVWCVDTGESFDVVHGATRARAVAYSTDGLLLAVAGDDRAVSLWIVGARNAAHKGSLTGHTEPVAALVFGADGKTLLSASEDGTVRFWDYAAARETGLIKTARTVYCLALAPGSKTVACGEADGALRLRKVPGGEVKAEFAVGCRSAAFSPGGGLLAAACDDGQVRLWDIAQS
jgi:WD40 repeat protein